MTTHNSFAAFAMTLPLALLLSACGGENAKNSNGTKSAAKAGPQYDTFRFGTNRLCVEDNIVNPIPANYAMTLKHNNNTEYELTFDDGTPSMSVLLCNADYSDAPVIWAAMSEPSDESEYDFKQSYSKYCVDKTCEGIANSFFQKYSDYSSDLLTEFGVSTDWERFQVKQRLGLVYSGVVAMNNFGNREHPTDHIYTGILSPNGNPDLHEYKFYIRMQGDSGFDKIKDWGARVRCAPVNPSTPFQTTPCPK